jgi:hypothetical protein
MCLICIEFQKGKMTVEEGWRNLSEMEGTMKPQHVEEVEEMLWDEWTALQCSFPTVDDDPWYWEHGQGD